MNSNQDDITAVFLHAKLDENEKVFVKMPKRFEHYDKHGKQSLIRLKNTLYGIHLRPRDFLKYLTKTLIASGMIQHNLDSCLFIGEKFICIVYVDELIFWAKD